VFKTLYLQEIEVLPRAPAIEYSRERKLVLSPWLFSVDPVRLMLRNV